MRNVSLNVRHTLNEGHVVLVPQQHVPCHCTPTTCTMSLSPKQHVSCPCTPTTCTMALSPKQHVLTCTPTIYVMFLHANNMYHGVVPRTTCAHLHPNNICHVLASQQYVPCPCTPTTCVMSLHPHIRVRPTFLMNNDIRYENPIHLFVFILFKLPMNCTF